MMSDTKLKRYRCIDDSAAKAGAQLLDSYLSAKADQANVALMFQQPDHHQHHRGENNNDGDRDADGKFQLGTFPANGNVADISILPRLFQEYFAEQRNAKSSSASDSCRHLLSGTAALCSDNNPLKKFFPIAPGNHCTNFGSFGCAPLPITLAQSLYQMHVIDSDADNFMRNELYGRIRDVRRAIADYICLPDEKELFLVDNAADAMNAAMSSLLFNPLFLKEQWAFRCARLSSSSSSSSLRPVFKVLALENAYPMVQECMDHHMNRLTALSSFSPSSSPPPYEYEIIKLPFTREMAQSLSSLPVVKRLRKNISTTKTRGGAANIHEDDEDAENDYENVGFPGAPNDGDGAVVPLFIQAIVDAVLTQGCTAVVLDHVMFAPALISPVDEIARRIKRVAPETLVIVDGAHSLGQVPLDFSQKSGACMAGSTPDDTPRAQGIDVFLSNCHKWLAAPKVSAILYVREELHAFLHPVVISNMHRGDGELLGEEKKSAAVPSTTTTTTTTTTRSRASRGGNYLLPQDETHSQKLHTEFIWRGTRDHTPFLCLADLLYFRYAVSSPRADHDERWLRANRQLTLRGARRMAEIWCTEVLLAEAPHCLPSMACVRFPVADVDLVRAAVTHSMAAHTNFLACVVLQTTEQKKEPWARVGGQVYNELADFEFAAKSFLEAVKVVREREREREREIGREEEKANKKICVLPLKK